jgi:hypothetical protein
MSYATKPGAAGAEETAGTGMTDSLVIPSRFCGPRDGRKLPAGSAVLGPGAEVLAWASAVWVTVPRPVPALAAKESS